MFLCQRPVAAPHLSGAGAGREGGYRFATRRRCVHRRVNLRSRGGTATRHALPVPPRPWRQQRDFAGRQVLRWWGRAKAARPRPRAFGSRCSRGMMMATLTTASA